MDKRYETFETIRDKGFGRVSDYFGKDKVKKLRKTIRKMEKEFGIENPILIFNYDGAVLGATREIGSNCMLDDDKAMRLDLNLIILFLYRQDLTINLIVNLYLKGLLDDAIATAKEIVDAKIEEKTQSPWAKYLQ